MAKAPARTERLKIMVSSPVYGFEDLLDQVYALLSGFGYEVWMSHKGTLPIDPNKTAFENCLIGVDRCDLFLAIITPMYGSGKIDKALSITHQELLRAIQQKKPRWILAHDHIPFARTLLNSLEKLKSIDRAKLKLKKNAVLDDLRVIDMYEAAIRHDIQVYQDRQGNWVQKFSRTQDAMLFVTSQFGRQSDVEQFLKEQFKDEKSVRRQAAKGVR